MSLCHTYGVCECELCEDMCHVSVCCKCAYVVNVDVTCVL